MMEFFDTAPWALSLLTGLLGLVIGSFLNVVIHRLPIMLERDWRRECQMFLGLETESPASTEPFNLAVPGSQCPYCSKPISALENIPVLSYLWLKGRCSGCHASIPLRYPAIELLTALLSFAVAYRFGATVQMVAALGLTWCLVALSGIDIDRQLLPDVITLPMLWLGLLLSVFGLFTDSTASILGAVAGYMALWLIYQTFKRLTGKEGMGYGDFKLLALLGAWLGWSALPLIVILSSVVGAVSGILMMLLLRHDHRMPIPFGPYLAAAGWLAMLWGEDLNALYLGWIAPV